MPIEQDVPLHIALAWIFSRDHDFVFEVHKNGCSPLESAFSAFNLLKAKKAVPAVGTAEESWVLLRDAVASGSLKIFGVPFEKGHHINAVGLFDTPYELERDVRKPDFPPSRISRELVTTLVVDEASKEFRLRPHDWYSEGGHWWREVELSWSDLLRDFGEVSLGSPEQGDEILAAGEPTSVQQPIDAAAEPSSATPSQDPKGYRLDEAVLNGMTRSRADILRTYVMLRCKNRRPYRNHVARDRDIQNHLNPGLHGAESSSPASETIGRAFRDYKGATGVDLMRIDEFCP